MVWLEFTVCGVLMIFSAHALCVKGVGLARAAHIEESVIGIFFLAVATSFPEIAVGVSSVSYVGRFSLGYGNLLGSVMINSMLLLAIDFSSGRGRVLANVTGTNFTTAVFLGIAALIIALTALLGKVLSLALPGPVGFESVLIAAFYFAYLNSLKKKVLPGGSVTAGASRRETALWPVWAAFLSLVLVVAVLGVWMANIGEKLAVTTGLSHTFVGATLLALITSFPEIVVSLAAVKTGAVQMAVGNVLGSNLFDLSVLPVLDLFTKSPALGTLTAGQIAVAGIALLISLITLAGMKIRSRFPVRAGLDTALIFASGVCGLAILFFVK